MIKLAKRMATACFGIGMAIGLVVTLSLRPATAAARLDPPPACPDTTRQDQDISDFVDVQCQVQETIFADGVEPGMAYGFGTDITRTGLYYGERWNGSEVSFDAVHVLELNIKDSAPALYSQGVSARAVVGKLGGRAGGAYIRGAVMSMGTLSTDTKYLLLVASVISENDVDLYAQATRVQAGVRALDVQTFVSYPLSAVTSASAMSASPDDLASLYGTGVNAGGGGVDANCVKSAYGAYNIAMKAANDRLANCIVDAVTCFAICMRHCAVGSFFAGPIVVVACSLACLA
ncbi:MAG: hypothetical protein ACK4WH_06425, partial [Phycisphaerales bacterium]